MAYDNTSLNLFEQFIDLTTGLFDLFASWPWVTMVLGPLSIVFNWVLFDWHKTKLAEDEFFFKYIHVTGRFEKPIYEVWGWISKTILPVGILVIGYSFLTGFKTLPFLSTFGVKGNNKVKKALLRKAQKFQQLE